jgi:hypothetical protein
MDKEQREPLIFKGHDIDTLDAAALREAVRWLAGELRKGRKVWVGDSGEIDAFLSDAGPRLSGRF